MAVSNDQDAMRTFTDRAPDTVRRPVSHTGEMTLEKPRKNKNKYMHIFPDQSLNLILLLLIGNHFFLHACKAHVSYD